MCNSIFMVVFGVDRFGKICFLITLISTADFMKLTDEHIHLVTAKSKMCGYWTSEIGGLNETIHISEYG